MTRNPFSRRSDCLRGFPPRWAFVARPLLTWLVVAVALIQAAPVGLTASRYVVEYFPDALVNQSLDADTHAAEHWAIQPTAAPRGTGEQPNELELLGGSWAPFLASRAILNCPHDRRTHRELVGGRHQGATLVNLNVRLQI